MSKYINNINEKQDITTNPPFRAGEKIGSDIDPIFRVGEKVGMHVEAAPIIFQRAQELRKRETKAEQTLWEELKGKKLGGYKFRRQHPVMKYVLDFYCHPCKLAIELDGDYHFTEEQKEFDEMRTRDMVDNGIEVIRFTNNAIEDELKKVKEVILEIVKTKMQKLA